MMKSLLLISFFSAYSVIPELNDSITSDYFEVHCSQTDAQIVINELLPLAERLYSELSADFQHSFESKISLILYPTIAEFHQKMGVINYPEWLVAGNDEKTIHIVSPNNPGTYHTSESIKKILQLNIIKTFIYSKYGLECAPFWFVFGIASVRTGYFQSSLINNIPTWQQFSTAHFSTAKINGHYIAHCFVHFIKQEYGWQTILNILENYSAFEKIVGYSPEALYNHWASIITNNL
jgi:hypothetical protein